MYVASELYLYASYSVILSPKFAGMLAGAGALTNSAATWCAATMQPLMP